MERTLIQALADYATHLSFEDLPPQVVSKANDAIFDLIGCYYGAFPDPICQEVLLNSISHSHGEEATLWGTGKKISADEAAMAMGFLGYALEYDDGVSLGGHWGSASIPSAIATAEKEGRSGKDLIVAVVCGYDIGTRISQLYAPLLLSHKVHFPCAMGFYAAASAVGRLMGLSSEQFALGLSNGGLAPVGPYSTAVSGGQIKSMYSGWPDFLGIRLMEWGRKGIGGDVDLFESPDGIGMVFSGKALDEGQKAEALSNLGIDFKLMHSYFKPYPCNRWLHAPLYLLQNIIREKGEIPIAVIVDGPSFLSLYDTRGDYTKKVKAQYSIPYTLAAMLLHRRCGICEFETDFRTSDAIQQMTERIALRKDPELDAKFPSQFVVRVTAKFLDGTEILKQGGLPWSPTQPATKQELIGKFRHLACATLPQTDLERWITLYTKGFEKGDNFNQMLSLLAKPYKPWKEEEEHHNSQLGNPSLDKM